jgi:hypothetical protein
MRRVRLFGCLLWLQRLTSSCFTGTEDLLCIGLKPENILLEQSKDFDQVKIIDFGTAVAY